jgi:hypothetical protein
MDINKSVIIGFLFDSRVCSLALLFCLFLIITGCAKISNPEKSGGDILAVPEGPWCSFSISGDGKWMQYMGDESPFLNPDAINRSHQRETFLTNLETGESYFAEPDPNVQNRIAQGLGPDGLGCFSPDHTKLYFTMVDWNSSPQNNQQADEIRNDRSPSAKFAIPSRQIDRYYYVVDLITKPFVIRESDRRECAERPDAVKPDIRVQRPTNKVVELYSTDGHRGDCSTQSVIGI